MNKSVRCGGEIDYHLSILQYSGVRLIDLHWEATKRDGVHKIFME